jgi:hypothetical protein
MGLTLILWFFMIVFFLTAKRNKINLWCGITALIFSIGTFKEYFYYVLTPLLIDYGFALDLNVIKAVYSIMTAILYYLVMPCAFNFSLYYISFHTKHEKLFHIHKFCRFLPAILLSFYFHPNKIHYYQQTSRIFWYIVSFYNIAYGIIITFIMIRSVYSAIRPIQKRQNKLICIITIPPVWYWLITIFVVHSMQLTEFYKIWKISTYLLLISLFVYIISAFSDGIMGLKIKIQMFNWNSEMSIVNKGGNYITHALKNEITKLEWCVSNLIHYNTEALPEELTIMERSINHLKQFIYKTQLYSNDIILKKEVVNILTLITDAIAATKLPTGDALYFNVDCPNDINILCDPIHMLEVINNIISNSIDAMNGSGTISISCKINKRMLVIAITDMGKGIPKKYLNNLFSPFFTTKDNSSHFGLGLSYCYSVMKKHNGYIDVQSIEGISSTFYLYLPID